MCARKWGNEDATDYRFVSSQDRMKGCCWLEWHPGWKQVHKNPKEGSGAGRECKDESKAGVMGAWDGKGQGGGGAGSQGWGHTEWTCSCKGAANCARVSSRCSPRSPGSSEAS